MELCFRHYSPGKNSNLNAPVLLRQDAAPPTHYRTERWKCVTEKKNVLHYFVDLSCSRSLQVAVKLLALGSLYIRAKDWWRHVTLKWGLSDSPPLWHIHFIWDAATRAASLHLNVYFPHTQCVGGNKKNHNSCTKFIFATSACAFMSWFLMRRVR